MTILGCSPVPDKKTRPSIDSLNIVRSTLAEVTRILLDYVKTETRLDELGLDLLMVIELLDLFASKYQISFHPSDLETCIILGEISQVIASEAPSTIENSNLLQPFLSGKTMQASSQCPMLIQ